MEKRYRVLHFVAILWKILAWLVLILGLLGSIGGLIFGLAGGSPALWRSLGVEPAFAEGSLLVGIVSFIGGLIVTLLYFLMIFAAGEMISLFIDLEENTRLTALWAREQLPSGEYESYE
ncbi:MAG: hypothetical protein ACP5GX_00100 [Anaerolineae bacterium]